MLATWRSLECTGSQEIPGELEEWSRTQEVPVQLSFKMYLAALTLPAPTGAFYKSPITTSEAVPVNPIELVQRGTLSQLFNFISSNGPDFCDPDSGFTLLAAAAGASSTEKILALLSLGANVNARSRDGSTALHAACAVASPETVFLLLQMGAWIDAPDDEGETPLFWAIRESAGTVVRLLVEAGGRTDICNADYETPVQFALGLGEKAIVHQLLNPFASPCFYP